MPSHRLVHGARPTATNLPPSTLNDTTRASLWQKSAVNLLQLQTFVGMVTGCFFTQIQVPGGTSWVFQVQRGFHTAHLYMLIFDQLAELIKGSHTPIVLCLVGCVGLTPQVMSHLSRLLKKSGTSILSLWAETSDITMSTVVGMARAGILSSSAHVHLGEGTVGLTTTLLARTILSFAACGQKIRLFLFNALQINVRALLRAFKTQVASGQILFEFGKEKITAIAKDFPGPVFLMPLANHAGDRLPISCMSPFQDRDILATEPAVHVHETPTPVYPALGPSETATSGPFTADPCQQPDQTLNFANGVVWPSLGAQPRTKAPVRKAPKISKKAKPSSVPVETESSSGASSSTESTVEVMELPTEAPIALIDTTSWPTLVADEAPRPIRSLKSWPKPKA